MTLEALGEEVHAMALRKGWWRGEQRERVELLLDWIVEEVEEAREAYRARGTALWYSRDAEGLAKPEGIGSELADIAMIVFDLALGLGVVLPADVREKLSYNLLRKYRRDADGRLIDA